MRTDVKETTL